MRTARNRTVLSLGGMGGVTGLVAAGLLVVGLPALASAETPPGPSGSAGGAAAPAGSDSRAADTEPATASPPATRVPESQATGAGAPPPSPPGAATPIPIGTAPPGAVAPAFPPAIPSIDYGGRLRAGIRFQDPAKPTSFGDVSQTLTADLYASGQIHPMWKWLIAITTDTYGGAAGQTSTVSLGLLDAMAGFVPMPELQLWVGRMLVMADRYAPSGPWGLDEWFFPGLYVGTPPALPKAGPSGRDVGATLWGAPLKGHLKYYLGAYQLQDPTLSPLFSGRVQVSLLSPEPGWFQRTTYYGDRDLVSVGIGGQLQRNGSVMTVPAAPAGMMPATALLDNYREFNADLIVEKRLGTAGGLSLEAAYYNFHGTYQPWNWSAVGAVAYNSPVIQGIGKLRPSLRFQQAQAKQTTSAGASLDPSRIYDAQLTYVVMNWFAHVVLTYRHYDMSFASPSAAAPAAAPPHSKGDMIVIGVQLWDP